MSKKNYTSRYIAHFVNDFGEREEHIIWGTSGKEARAYAQRIADAQNEDFRRHGIECRPYIFTGVVVRVGNVE